jgi:hypothetical protein
MRALKFVPIVGYSDKSIFKILAIPFYIPICSMYGIFTNIGLKNHPNVGKYTIHGSYGYVNRQK